jgi:aspartyl-tRNA(Asn)/glutamyl-tRNA(Gln) amidotransferase subunit A
MAELPSSLVGLRAAISAGRISADEALALQFARAPAVEAATHCVVTALPLPDMGAAGAPPAAAPLAGVALAHKDIFSLQGRAPGCGVHRGRTDAACLPATVISSLQQAGAAQSATLVMAPLACGATGENPNSEQRVVNPLAPAAAVGGSSSGSAVAVAAGLCYASLGTDTAGSVRIPAATCGVIGLKTTADLLSLEGVMPLAPSLDGVGILSRHAEDAAALLRVLAPRLREHPPNAVTRLDARLFLKQLDGAVADALTAFCAHAGLRLDAAAAGELAEHAELTRLAETLLHVEASRLHRRGLQQQDLPDSAIAVALPGVAIPDAWHGAAKAARAGHARAFAARYFGDKDVLLLPALPATVPDWDAVDTRSPGFQGRTLLALHRYMGFVNYLGFPALVLPVAHDARGLPICVQAVARPYHEHTLLRFATEATAAGWGLPPP